MPSRMAWESGTSPAPQAPCSSRKITISLRFCATPHSAEARVKPTIEVMTTRLMPKRPASQPLIGVMMAEATR